MQQVLRFFSAGDVRRLLPMREAIRAMREAFTALSEGQASLPPRIHIDIPAHSGSSLVMPCYLPKEAALSVKVVSLFAENPARGLPLLHALVLLVDARTGAVLAAIEGASLTALRTGAASGLATELLARPDAETAAIFGSGVQGRAQLEAVAAVRPLRAASVYDPKKEAAKDFARTMEPALGIPISVAATPREALSDALVACTATTSQGPVFADEDLRPGTHINAVGSYRPTVREIPTETVRRARVVVDHRSSALAEAGDLLIPLEEGAIAEDHFADEIGEIASGTKRGRFSPEQITLFKSVGVAVQDLCAAACIYRKGSEEEKGRSVSLSS